MCVWCCNKKHCRLPASIEPLLEYARTGVLDMMKGDEWNAASIGNENNKDSQCRHSGGWYLQPHGATVLLTEIRTS